MTEHAIDLSEVTVIMPIGGKGIRARDITQDQIPKPLIRLGNGDTVLSTITTQLQHVGFRTFVFCVGYMKQQLIDHIEQGDWVRKPDTTYAIDELDKLLGPDGTVLHAIGALGLKGQGMLIPGDVMLPWNNLVGMNQHHGRSGADLTFGVTSQVTERMSDIGKIVVDDLTGRLLWGYGRTDEVPLPSPGTRNMTSAPSHVISIGRYAEMCASYRYEHPEQAEQPLSFRDEMLPWIRTTGNFVVQTYDIEGEILDLGTPGNIRYGQLHWQDYVAD